MNEEVLLKLYNKYNLSTVGNFEQFKSAMATPEGQRIIYDKHLSKVGTFEQLQQAVGAQQVEQQTDDQPEQQGTFRTVGKDSPVGKFVQSVPGLISRGATQFVPSILEVAGAGEALIGSGLRKLGINEGEPLLPKAAKATREFIEEGTYVDPEIEQSLAGQVAMGVGQVIPFIATSGLSGGAQFGARAPQVMGAGKQLLETGKAIGKQATTPQGIIGGSMIAGPEWTAAKEAGLSDEDAFNTMVQNYFVGQTEVIPIQNALRVLDRVTGGSLINTLKAMGTGGFQEAVQETFQTYLTNQIAKGSYDPERDPMFQVLESAKVGGLVGMLIPAVGSVVPRATPREQEKLKQKVTELQIDEEIAKADTGNPEINQTVDDQTTDVVNAIADPPSQDLTVKQPDTQQDTEGEVSQKDTIIGTEPSVDFTSLPTEFEQSPFYTNYDRQRKAEKSGEITPETEALIDKVNRGEPLTESEIETLTKATGKDYTPTKDERAEQVRDFLASKNINDVGQFAQEWNKHIEKKSQMYPEENRAKFIKQNQLSKPDIKRVDNLLKTPRGRAFDGEKVVRTVNAEIKRIAQEFGKGKTKGVRESVRLMREQINKARQAFKEANLSRQQSRAILRKLNSTNFFTPGSVSDLNQFVAKVVKDAEYATKVGKAEANKLKINRNAPKKGVKGLTKQEKSLIVDFLRLDPSKVDIDGYIEKSQQILDSYKPVGRGFKAAPQVEISEWMKDQAKEMYRSEFGTDVPVPNTVQKIVDEITQKKLDDREAARKEKLLTSDLSAEEIDLLLSGEDSIYKQIEDTGKREEAKEKLKILAGEAQASLPDKIDGISDVQQKELDSLKELDLDMMDADQLKFLIKAVDRITVNKDFGGVGNLEAEAMAQKNFKILLDKMKGTSIGKIFGLDKEIDSLSMLHKAIFGLSKAAAQFQVYMGISGVAEARAASFKANNETVDLLNKLRDKYPKAFTDEGLLRGGVVSTLIRQDTDRDAVEAFEDNKMLIEETIATYDAAGDSNSVKEIEKAYKPYRKAESIDDVIKIVAKDDPQIKAVIDENIKLWDQYWEDLGNYNRKYFNEYAPRVNNYTGEQQWMTVMEKGFTPSDAVEQIQKPKGVTMIGSPKRFASAHKLTHKARRDKNTGKVLPHSDGKVLNLNKLAITLDQVPRVVFQMKAMPHMIAVRNNANRMGDDGVSIIKKEIFGWKVKNKKAISRADYTWKALFNDVNSPDKGTYFDYEATALRQAASDMSDADRIVARVLQPMRVWGYALALGGPSQALKQSAVYANAHIQLTDNMAGGFNYMPYKDLITDREGFNAFMKMNTVGYRKEKMSVWDLGEIMTREQVKNFKQQYKNFIASRGKRWVHSASGWATGMEFLTTFDANAAEVSFGGFYKQYMAKHGVKWKNWQHEINHKDDLVRQEARAYAKQKVDELQVPSDPAEQGRFVKSQNWKAQLFKARFLPFGTFNNNAKVRQWHDYKYLMFGNKAQRQEAARDLMGTWAEIIAFAKMNTFVKGSIYGPILAYVAYLFGADEPDEEMKEEMQKKAITRERTMMFLDGIPFILTDPNNDILIKSINEVYYQAMTRKGTPGEGMTRKEFGDEVGEIFESQANFQKSGGLGTLTDLLGVYGMPINKGEKLIESFADIIGNEDKEYPLSDEQKRFAIFVTALESMNFAGGAPSDITFAAKRELRTQKQINRRYGYRNPYYEAQ